MNDKTLWGDLDDKEFRDSFAEALIDDRISAQIYHLRRYLGWTQKDLAEHSGVSAPTISGLENSTTSPTLATLRKIASAFDVALNVRFVEFSTLVVSKDAIDAQVKSYNDDSAPYSRRLPQAVRVLASGRNVFMVPATKAEQNEATTYTAPAAASKGKAYYVN